MNDIGCDQYHFDNDDTNTLISTGRVSSFNYNNGNGRHLAGQDQTICIRREEGKNLNHLQGCWNLPTSRGARPKVMGQKTKI